MEFQNLSNLEIELMELSAKCSIRLVDKNSKRHLALGYLNRFFMIQSKRHKIISIIKMQEEKPLQQREAIDLKIYLNSFYVNLRGALDNLAWLLNYELGLQDTISESSQKGNSRKFTDLFGKPFLDKLHSKNETIPKELDNFSLWYKDLKDFRDPAAHRIPLAFLQSTITEDDFENLMDLQKRWEELNKLFSQGDIFKNLEKSGEKLDEALSILNEYSNVGKFSPIIITSEGSTYAVRSAEKQIEDDYKNFLEISKVIFVNL